MRISALWRREYTSTSGKRNILHGGKLHQSRTSLEEYKTLTKNPESIKSFLSYISSQPNDPKHIPWRDIWSLIEEKSELFSIAQKVLLINKIAKIPINIVECESALINSLVPQADKLTPQGFSLLLHAISKSYIKYPPAAITSIIDSFVSSKHSDTQNFTPQNISNALQGFQAISKEIKNPRIPHYTHALVKRLLEMEQSSTNHDILPLHWTSALTSLSIYKNPLILAEAVQSTLPKYVSRMDDVQIGCMLQALHTYSKKAILANEGNCSSIMSIKAFVSLHVIPVFCSVLGDKKDVKQVTTGPLPTCQMKNSDTIISFLKLVTVLELLNPQLIMLAHSSLMNSWRSPAINLLTGELLKREKSEPIKRGIHDFASSSTHLHVKEKHHTLPSNLAALACTMAEAIRLDSTAAFQELTMCASSFVHQCVLESTPPPPLHKDSRIGVPKEWVVCVSPASATMLIKAVSKAYPNKVTAKCIERLAKVFSERMTEFTMANASSFLYHATKLQILSEKDYKEGLSRVLLLLSQQKTELKNNSKESSANFHYLVDSALHISKTLQWRKEPIDCIAPITDFILQYYFNHYRIADKVLAMRVCDLYCYTVENRKAYHYDSEAFSLMKSLPLSSVHWTRGKTWLLGLSKIEFWPHNHNVSLNILQQLNSSFLSSWLNNVEGSQLKEILLYFTGLLCFLRRQIWEFEGLQPNCLIQEWQKIRINAIVRMMMMILWRFQTSREQNYIQEHLNLQESISLFLSTCRWGLSDEHFRLLLSECFTVEQLNALISDTPLFKSDRKVRDKTHESVLKTLLNLYQASGIAPGSIRNESTGEQTHVSIDITLSKCGPLASKII